jgi:hypothetical protein
MTPPTDRIPATLVPMDLEGVRVHAPPPWHKPAEGYDVTASVHYILSDRPEAPKRVAMVDYHWFEPWGDERRDRGASNQVRIADLFLDLTHRSGRYALAVALAAGEKCPRAADVPEEHVSGSPTVCSWCAGTGYLRPPADVFRWLPTGEGGQTRPEWSPGLLACSAWRVARGLGSIVGVAGEWTISDDCSMRVSPDDEGWVVCYVGPNGNRPASGNWTPGWTLYARGRVVACGPETGDLGRSLADRAALAAGYALADGDGLVLPWPEVTT